MLVYTLASVFPHLVAEDQEYDQQNNANGRSYFDDEQYGIVQSVNDDGCDQDKGFILFGRLGVEFDQ